MNTYEFDLPDGSHAVITTTTGGTLDAPDFCVSGPGGAPFEGSSRSVFAAEILRLANERLGSDQSAILDDLAELLRALGLGDHARAKSPHEVFQGEALPAVRAIVARATELERVNALLEENRRAWLAWADPIRASVIALEAERDEFRLDVACRWGTIDMAIARLGGMVEGRPTERVNFLQRIDELREIEAEHDGSRKALAGRQLRALGEAGAVLEALRASVKWELAPEIKEAIERVLVDHVRPVIQSGLAEDQADVDALPALPVDATALLVERWRDRYEDSQEELQEAVAIVESLRTGIAALIPPEMTSEKTNPLEVLDEYVDGLRGQHDGLVALVAKQRAALTDASHALTGTWAYNSKVPGLDRAVYLQKLLARIESLLSSDAAQKAAEEARQAKLWKVLFDEVAIALKCLPSAFADANGHVLEKARRLQSRLQLESELGAAHLDIKRLREFPEKVKREADDLFRKAPWAIGTAQREAWDLAVRELLRRLGLDKEGA